jgi:hypothetical protein
MFDPTTLTHTLLTQVSQRHRALGAALYGEAPLDPSDPSVQCGPLQHDMLLLVQVANGEIDRTTADDDTIATVLDAVHRVVDVLTVPAGGSTVATVSSTFWSQSGIGQVLTHVHAWLRQDDLIGYTEAASLLFPDLAQQNIQAARMRIKRMVERGDILSYIDPTEPNPTRQTRVSRQAIEALAVARQQHPKTPLHQESEAKNDDDA